jgi:hypothetical protein
VDDFLRRIDLFGVVLGVILLFVGAWYFLDNTLGLNIGEIDGDKIWPILVIALGGGILLRAWRRATREEPQPPGP